MTTDIHNLARKQEADIVIIRAEIAQLAIQQEAAMQAGFNRLAELFLGAGAQTANNNNNATTATPVQEEGAEDGNIQAAQNPAVEQGDTEILDVSAEASFVPNSLPSSPAPGTSANRMEKGQGAINYSRAGASSVRHYPYSTITQRGDTELPRRDHHGKTVLRNNLKNIIIPSQEQTSVLRSEQSAPQHQQGDPTRVAPSAAETILASLQATIQGLRDDLERQREERAEDRALIQELHAQLEWQGEENRKLHNMLMAGSQQHPIGGPNNDNDVLISQNAASIPQNVDFTSQDAREYGEVDHLGSATPNPPPNVTEGAEGIEIDSQGIDIDSQGVQSDMESL
ncbi:MAG: hypothetical protein J3R72DRAFT_70300 [Linnemannia gamsii]|nr:MAG: hypothetical protein J3R72DRAFT_70300 [Linnemannia gamsii]